MNGLGNVLEQDMVRFLDHRMDPKLDKKKVLREEEFTLFDMQRDFSKELKKALTQNNVRDAKKIYTELKTHYETEATDPAKKKRVFPILKELHEKIMEYKKKHVKDKDVAETFNDIEPELPEPGDVLIPEKESPDAESVVPMAPKHAPVGDPWIDVPKPKAAEDIATPPVPQRVASVASLDQGIDWESKVEDLKSMVFEASNLIEDDIDAAKEYAEKIKHLEEVIPAAHKSKEIFSSIVDLNAKIRSQERALVEQERNVAQEKDKESVAAKEREKALQDELNQYKQKESLDKKKKQNEEEQLVEQARNEQEELDRKIALQQEKEEREMRKQEEEQLAAEKAARREAAEKAKQEHEKKHNAFKYEMSIRQLIKTIEDQIAMNLLKEAEASLTELTKLLDQAEPELIEPMVLETYNSKAIALEANIDSLKKGRKPITGEPFPYTLPHKSDTDITIIEQHPESNRRLTMHELYTKGLYYFHERHYDDAIKVFKEILRRKPNSLSAKIRIQEAQDAKRSGSYGW